MAKRILDACCGSRMFWFDKENPDVEFVDIRDIEEEIAYNSNGKKTTQKVRIHPTTVADFTQLPFADNSFYHVVFDPPHVFSLTKGSWLAKKYGALSRDPDVWKPMIKSGFDECMRVLKPNGTLIFKWSEKDIKVSEIINVIGFQPLYGHRSGKYMTTHWMAFVKDEEVEE